VLVGFGRFGRAIAEVLDREGIEWKALEPQIGAGGVADIDVDGEGDARLLHGDNGEHLLRDAGIENADALVAGSNIDAVNLGATTLARRARPDIFVIIRQNHMQDRALVAAARANLEFVQSDIMVHECLQVLKTPMLGRFIAQLREGDGATASATLERVRQEVGEGAPRAWKFECDVLQPGMFFAFFQRGGAPVTIGHLVADPTFPTERLRASALMIERDSVRTLLPDDNKVVRPGDRILFVGDDTARRLQQRYLTEPGTVAWVCSGSEPPRGLIFRWWHKRRARNES
jgi:Trk K+ transport system NAD-binding subunit